MVDHCLMESEETSQAVAIEGIKIKQAERKELILCSPPLCLCKIRRLCTVYSCDQPMIN